MPPTTATEKLAGAPAATLVLAGWVAMVGATGVTVSKALLLTAVPTALPTATARLLALNAYAALSVSAALVAPAMSTPLRRHW